METQVADFEEHEAEWAIDRILSHSGQRADSVFEIQWKSGDKTWLPYDRVEKLDALKDYFNVLGISNVSELGEGKGKPPTDDPQVFLGHLTLDLSIPTNTPAPSLPQLSTLPNPTIIIMAPLFRNFRVAGQNPFALANVNGDPTMTVTGDMLRLHLAYDAALRGGTHAQGPKPLGYAEIALAINKAQSVAGHTTRLAVEGTAGPVITGPPPALVEIIGEVANNPTPTAPQPRIPDGGRYLNAQRAELMEEALWMSLETTKKKREWRDRAIAERKAKKPKREGSTTTPGEGTHLEGPQMTPRIPSMAPTTTPTTQTPGASSSFADVPMDLELELGLAEAEERERTAGPKNDERRGEGSKKRRQG
jgi:hypothetical protein